MLTDVLSITQVKAAQARISGGVLQTPCLHSELLTKQLDCQLFLKAENLQHIGAFKARGALNAVLSLDDATAQRGVVTHSSGNHAAALARAAKLRGIPAHIVMPNNSAQAKIAAVRTLGVEPVFCEPTIQARESTAAGLQRETGANLVHPYDDPRVIAGQGTVALEMLAQVQGLDAIVAPVGGGGLLSGILTVVTAMNPDIRVYAAEPALADDCFRSLISGQIEAPQRYDTIADGLRSSLGQLTFPIIRDSVERILLVSEDAIVAAMRQLAESAKLIVEPSGAVALAAIGEHNATFKGQKVGVVLTGGNLDFDRFPSM